MLDLILLFLAFFLVLPFLVLTFYNNPSIDDYYFVFLVKKMGFWETQYSWYTTWTGRYSSMFLLSLHPLLLESFVIYKIISIAIIIATIHSFYRLITFFLNSLNFIVPLSLSFILSFTFFSGMPSLVQGLYWEPGSVTYQLANILLLHLMVNLIRIISDTTTKISTLQLGVNYFLIIIIGGLNETSMLLSVVLITILMGVDFLLRKKISVVLVKFEIVAIICVLVVMLAPGNTGREASFTHENSKDFYFTISSSFISAAAFIMRWIKSPQIIIASILIVLQVIIPQEKESRFTNKTKWYYLICIIVLGYILVAVSLSPGFWALGVPAPTRTINVSYWLFTCFWVVFLFVLIQLLAPLLFNVNRIVIYTLSLAFMLSLFFLKNNSYNTATSDLLSGGAYEYNQQFIERDLLMKTCKSKVCSIPSFTVFPSSIFNEELSTEDSDRWNHVYALYFGKETVHLVYRDPLNAATYFFDFESENNRSLQNLHTITDEEAYSLPNSSTLNEKEIYSATFTVALKDLSGKELNEFIGLRLSAHFFSSNPLSKTLLVVSIQDTSNQKIVLWRAKNVNYTENDTNKWVKTEYKIPINKKALSSNNKATIYVWNNGDSAKIFVDDLKILFY